LEGVLHFGLHRDSQLYIRSLGHFVLIAGTNILLCNILIVHYLVYH